MKSFTRAFATIAVVAALSMPSVALVAQGRDERPEKNPIVRIIQKVKKFITSLDDLPLPPIPKP